MVLQAAVTEALAALDTALAQKPDYAEALCNRGNILGELGRRDEALASYERVLQLRPGFRQAEINRANVLFSLGQSERELAAASAILREKQNHPQALCIRGAALQRLGKLEEALASFEVAARRAYPEAWLNRGNMLQELGRPEEALESAAEPGSLVETLGPHLDGGPDAFIDTAAVMACCHLIVTSDTSIAQLAGALGRPVFLALKHMPDWRWLATGRYSPWYPTMRLFRPRARGNWEAVFDEIAAAVRARIGLGIIRRSMRRPPAAPGAV